MAFPQPPAAGPKRDLAGEGAFEYGSRAGYWRLLDIFDEQEVKCTFYACAVALERNRDAAKQMRGRGHDVMSHGWRWEDVSLLTREEEREHIRLAIESILERIDSAVDLAEPFARIREAVIEARKMGVTSRAA